MINEQNALGDFIISPQVEDVKRRKIRSQEICAILSELAREQDKESKAYNIDNCGTWLNIRQYHDVAGTRKLHSANFCKSPLCPMCAWRKALKLTHQVGQAIEASEARYIYHLVLATDNTRELTKDGIKAFKASATRFIRKYITRDYAIALEITYSRERGYHPHIHALIGADAFIKVSADYIRHMAILWASFVGSKKPQNTFYITGITDRAKASRELTKYILKYEGIDINEDKDALKTIAVATSAMKKIQASGNMRRDIAQASRDYEQKREGATAELEKTGYELEIYKWLNGDYIRTN